MKRLANREEPERAEPRLRSLGWFNGLAPDRAEAELMLCCSSRVWARRVASGRPYPSRDHLMDEGDRVWSELGPADWLEAMAAHPRIGGSSTKGAATWSRQEQSVAAAAAQETLAALALANREYEARFGHVFLICATGLSADEILAALRSRIDHDAATELGIAAEEQRKITRLRLAKLLAP